MAPRILVIAGWYPNSTNQHTGRFVRNRVRAISRHNPVRVVHVYADPRVGSCDVTSSREEDWDTIYVRVPKRPISAIERYERHRAAQDAIHSQLDDWRPDVIHCEIYSAGYDGLAAARQTTIPVSVAEHWSGFLSGKMGISQMITARYVFGKAARVLPVSSCLGKVLSRRFGIAESRITPVPNVVSTDVFTPSSPHERTSELRLATVGRFVPGKGLSHLIRAVASLGRTMPVSLRMCGDGPLRSVLENEVAELGCSANVHFEGFVAPPARTAEVLRWADVVVQPSEYETFGIALYEALSCGKPVVATNLPVWEDAPSSGGVVLVEPRDSQQIVQGILKACDMGVDPESLHKWVDDRFSTAAVAAQFAELFSELAVGRPLMGPR